MCDSQDKEVIVDAENCSLLQSDIFLFSGATERSQAEVFRDVVESVHPRQDTASLILSTYGGDADAAYIIARCLKTFYSEFTVYVFGMCKSAGTLIVLGADEIVVSSRGELGPLDVQMLKEDVLTPRGSGLDVFDALRAIREQAFSVFEFSLLEVKKRSGGTISTKMAADIANTLAVGLLSPLSEQLDVLRLGEIQRAMNIAFEYGERLGASFSTLSKLIMGYPSHSFVIDCLEAIDLFYNARFPTTTECDLIEGLRGAMLQETNFDCVRLPYPGQGVIVHFAGAEDNEIDHQKSEHNDSEEGENKKDE